MSDTPVQPEHRIEVRARTQYLPEQSDIVQGRYVFAYTITIRNTGDTTAQLLSRHWIITDALGHEEQVRGPGVVGKQPHIAPGEAAEYSSFCPLETPHGAMRGSYRMVRPDGSHFDAEIAPFALMLPGSLN